MEAIDGGNGGGHQDSQQSKSSAYKKPYTKGKTPEEYLGFMGGYAKDMVIAGKTKNADIAAWKTLVRAMYSEIKEILNEENK